MPPGTNKIGFEKSGWKQNFGISVFPTETGMTMIFNLELCELCMEM
jgi:hypothetical protein